MTSLCLPFLFFFFFNDTATTEIYTLSLHDALPIYPDPRSRAAHRRAVQQVGKRAGGPMSRIPFQKPKKVEWEILSDQYGRLVAEPFEKGYALTVGNSLRRTLLSIVPGAAVSWVKIDGVRNVDARIPGVTESTVDV